RPVDRKSFYVVEEPVEIVQQDRSEINGEDGRLVSEKGGLFSKLAIRKQSPQNFLKKDVMSKLEDEEMNVKLPQKGKLKKRTEAQEALEVKTTVVSSDEKLENVHFEYSGNPDDSEDNQGRGE
ncbi:MAG: hypothetical protein IKV65_05630, partial [Erysipelotrichaceae bacterium]|nr:hypothetical protein [Erysipelotrichaceae bacterium]